MRISDWSSDVCSSDLTDGNANVESADHEGQDRHKHKSRNTHPKYNEPGLKSVIIGYDRKKLGNDVGRTIHEHSQGESRHRNASELAIEKEAVFQDGLRRVQLQDRMRTRMKSRHSYTSRMST